MSSLRSWESSESNYYDTDTIAARNNRAASQKFYNHFVTSTRSILPTEFPAMLHRSPSGAKRKIRQRREEQGSRPSPFLSPSSSTSTTSSPAATVASPNEQSNYRSLIDSGGYQSILPEIRPSFVPTPAPRLSTSFSSSMSLLETSSPSAAAAASSTALGIPPIPPAKPTVEVHPMPNEERVPVPVSQLHHHQSMDGEQLKKQKPAVPAKPKGLLIDHMARSTSLTSLASPINQTANNFLNNLVNSPSLLNLQKAYNNPEMGSQEFKRLESSRIESIQKVNRRLSEYERDRKTIEEEIDQINRIGDRLLSTIEMCDRNLAAKIQLHLENSKELLKLETKLRYQMEKIKDHLNYGGADQSEGLLEESRLRRRLQDAAMLRNTYNRRERDLDRQMMSILEEEESRQFNLFKETLMRLVEDSRIVEDRISDAQLQLRTLHTTSRVSCSS